MARPAGHPMNRFAWEHQVAEKKITPTSVGRKSGVPRVTVAALVHGHHRASVEMALQVAAGAEFHNPATLFPTLATTFAASGVKGCELIEGVDLSEFEAAS